MSQEHKQIIIVQRHKENLDGIKHMMEQQLPKIVAKTMFFTSPNAALRASEGSDKKTIVILGNVFEETDLKGNHFAGVFKGMMKNTKVYCYSVCPSPGNNWDGSIEKEWGTCGTGDHANLIEFLRPMET